MQINPGIRNELQWLELTLFEDILYLNRFHLSLNLLIAAINVAVAKIGRLLGIQIGQLGHDFVTLLPGFKNMLEMCHMTMWLCMHYSSINLINFTYNMFYKLNKHYLIKVNYGTLVRLVLEQILLLPQYPQKNDNSFRGSQKKLTEYN